MQGVPWQDRVGMSWKRYRISCVNIMAYFVFPGEGPLKESRDGEATGVPA